MSDGRNIELEIDSFSKPPLKQESGYDDNLTLSIISSRLIICVLSGTKVDTRLCAVSVTTVVS